MRILIAIFALFPAFASARCASAYLGTWPPKDTPLPANGVVLVEGFGDDQPVVAALGGPAKAWLEWSGGRVALTVKALNIGHFKLTQAVLQPVTALKVGRTYTLVLEKEGQPYRPQRWIDGGREATTWKVAAADEAAPVWTGAPKITERVHVEYGCGPATEVVVQAPLEPGMAIEVTLSGPGGRSSWWLPVEDGVIRVGHGMCAGAFDVAGAGERVATLVAVDGAGNRSPAAELRFPGVRPEEGR